MYSRFPMVTQVQIWLLHSHLFWISTSQKIHPHADEMLAQIADGALDGARGNSGVILAQFFSRTQ